MARKILFASLGVAGAAALLLGGLYLFFTAWFNPSPPAANFPRPATALDAQRQDLVQFKRLVALDQAYAPADRAQANRAIDALGAGKAVLGWAGLRTQLMRIAAFADNGHTTVYSGDNRRPNAVPLRVAAFADGVYVLRTKADDADLLGARLEKVDGVPLADVLTKLDALRGGPARWRRTAALVWLQSPEILNGIGVAPQTDLTVWTLRTSDGREITRALKGAPLARGESFEDDIRWLSPEPMDGEPRSWRALAPATLPPTLRDFNRTFRRARLGNSCVLFLQMKAVTDGPDEKIADWIAQTQSAMAANKPCAVILDLRFNGGGDYTNTYAFAHRLPALMQPGARLYLLTGPHTFSAAISTAAFVKDALGPRTVILGEMVGDRLKFLSEGNFGCLPNSGICFHYSTGMHNYSAPCTDWRVCYWLNWFYPVRVRSLAPDETIALRFADWRSGHDAVFARALALAEPSH